MIRQFIFTRNFETEFGIISVGTEMDIVNGVIYINGGMIEPWYYDVFQTLISDEKSRNNYLREITPSSRDTN